MPVIATLSNTGKKVLVFVAVICKYIYREMFKFSSY